MNELVWILIGALLSTIILVVFAILKRSKSRKLQDKLVPQHKHSFRSPTWRFQKYHPDKCPHHNGIYRHVKIKVLDDTIKKTIFVCSDCVSAIEIDELKDREKFK